MDVSEYMNKRNLTDEALDALAQPYEDASFTSEAGEIHNGSHIDAVGTKRITVVYNARDAQRVARLARARGIKPSEIYRDALDEYLAKQK